MRTKLTSIAKVIFFGLILLSATVLNTNAQKVEKLIIYENFGGPAAGTSEPGIQPIQWPSVLADSNEYSGWYSTAQKLDGKNASTLVPQFYGNATFHIDSVLKYRDGGLPSGISVNNTTKRWYKGVPFLNGYTTAGESNSQLEFRFWDATVMSTFSSWISYYDYTPDYLKNQTDEIGYIYFAKDIAAGNRARVTLPYSDFDFLHDISKLEILFSGSRLGNLNTISIEIEEVDKDGITLGTTKYTYSASLEPRLVTVPVEKDYCRIYIQGWGAAKNGNVTDYTLSNSYTFADTTYTYNYNAVAGTLPSGDETAGQTSNPGIQLHMIKIYAMMDGAGYTVTTDDALVTGTKTGITHGATTTLTASATNGGGARFLGWNIEGRDNLSEVANPLTIEVTEDLTIMPVYVGDEVEIPVVNETFTNWKQRGNTLPDNNNMLEYNQGSPLATVFSGDIKVPYQYGFTSGSKDSLTLTLKACNVLPQYGLRVHNAPGWEEALGFVAFMGPNTDKGYVSLESIDGISKAVVTVSSYDQPYPNRAVAILNNGTVVRNKIFSTMYTDDIVIDNDPANAFQLQIGPGNQAFSEYLTPEAENVDIFTGISAAIVSMHNLKLYAKMPAPDKNFYQLTLIEGENGIITGVTPEPGNSTNHFLEGTKISVSARADEGVGFDGWYDASDNLVSQNNPYKFTISADLTLKAVFKSAPAYIQIEDNALGTITSNIKPASIDGNKWEFVAGNDVELTATPIFGYEFVKFVKNGTDVTENPMTVSNLELQPGATVTVSVEYAKILSTKKIAVWNDFTSGEILFSPDDSVQTVIGDTIFVKYPTGVTIEVKAEPNYSFGFTSWKSGMDVPAENLSSNPVAITLEKDKRIAPVWEVLPRNLLIINQGANGNVYISDEHRYGTEEQAGLWPEDYEVRVTAQGNQGYTIASFGPNVPYYMESDSVAYIKMIYDTVTVKPEFVERLTGVVVAVNQNFQDPTLWPENELTVSNVPGAIDFLGLAESWDPTQYNNDLESLLEILAPYRVWGSESNDNSDGPNGTKDPYTTLSLEFETVPYSFDLPIGTSQDNVKVTVANYAPCNDCLIGKAVKGSAISNHYLGHVTPGMVALRNPNVENRDSEMNPAFMAGDTVGVMIIEGLVYVEKLEIGYVSSGSQHCPGVFYSVDENLEVIDDDGLFNDIYGELWSIGQVSRPDYTPYNNLYGWGSAQEGMIMDQNMYIAEEDVPETKVIITSGYRDLGDIYQYTNIYIHDLKVWGSAHSLDINELLTDLGSDENKFYMLGSTNFLIVDIPEPVKTLVIYNMEGKAIKVITDLDTNQIDLGNLKPGVYGAHAYGRSGYQYKGSFGKLSY